VVIGLLIVTQLRAQQSAGQVLQSATEADLGQLVSSLNNEINTLRAETAGLKLQLYKIERINHDSKAVMEESIKNLNNLKVIAGLTQVRGSGIRAQISDDENALTSTDIVDIITELRSGGAEAISINGVRIIGSTGIKQNNHGIFIDGTMITPPYEVLAIGESEVLTEALTIAGGIRDKLSSLSGVSFFIHKENSIRINAARGKSI
jgi:uncharacterized protein YlxW (UPF0749 family)